ncbi:DUF6712 family protein [uncultured Prevotella sp.]|uniref:DUF6712 family protein n=1 Tax=uncultured Prevotella sp. TaxID=159272 RepID=UPI00345BFFC9
MYQRISAIEFSILCIGEYPIPSIIDIVNSIRLAKGNVFAEWKQSDTAKLFEDHGYKKRRVEGISSEKSDALSQNNCIFAKAKQNIWNNSNSIFSKRSTAVRP